MTTTESRARRIRSAPAGLAAAVLLALGLASTVNALTIFARDMARRDFGAFYFSGRAWAAGESPYRAGRPDLPNLNPPIVIAAVFAPLSVLPLAAAGAAWQLIGASALAFAAWRIVRTSSGPPPLLLMAAGVALVSVGSRYVWLEGQITWLLLVPMTEAWIAYRRGRGVAAGLWLAPVIVAKPFFAVSALAAGLPTALAAAAASLVVLLGALAVTTVPLWREWLALGPGISITWPSSASLWTLAARAEGARPLDVLAWSQLSFASTLLVAALAAPIVIIVARTGDRDERWIAALALGLLLSPLGWIYYLPLAVGPLVALAVRDRLTRVLALGIGLSCVPMQVLFAAIPLGGWAAVSLGAAYTWGVMLIVVGLRGARSKRA